jgi:hypothetical protein
MRTKRETRHTHLPSGSNSCVRLFWYYHPPSKSYQLCYSLLDASQWNAGLNPVQGEDMDRFRVLLCCCLVQAKFCYEPIPWQIRSLLNSTSKWIYILSGQQALKCLIWRIRIKRLIFVLCSFKSHGKLNSNIYILFFINLLHVRNNSILG